MIKSFVLRSSRSEEAYTVFDSLVASRLLSHPTEFRARVRTESDRRIHQSFVHCPLSPLSFEAQGAKKRLNIYPFPGFTVGVVLTGAVPAGAVPPPPLVGVVLVGVVGVGVPPPFPRPPPLLIWIGA